MSERWCNCGHLEAEHLDEDGDKVACKAKDCACKEFDPDTDPLDTYERYRHDNPNKNF